MVAHLIVCLTTDTQLSAKDEDPRKEILMNQDNQTNEYRARLTSLWNEGSKDIALSFLKRAVRHDMTLQELVHALQFPEVRDHIAGINLDDVLPRAAQGPQLAPQLAKHATGLPRPEKVARRKRRSSDEIASLRDALIGRLQAAVGSVTTSHLRDVLSNGGHDVDLLQLGRMLATLEEEGYITCLGGKPKAWRLKPQGRRAPEPLVIRKAQDIVAKEINSAN